MPIAYARSDCVRGNSWNKRTRYSKDGAKAFHGRNEDVKFLVENLYGALQGSSLRRGQYPNVYIRNTLPTCLGRDFRYATMGGVDEDQHCL